MSQSVVHLADVHRHYVTQASTVRALDGVSLDVEPGEFIAVAGPSGSGKSTMLNLIGALDVPTTGQVQVAGTTLQNLSRTQLAHLRRDRIGFVFQAYNLIPVLTAIENVEYVMLLQGVDRKERRDRAAAMLVEVGLGDHLDRRPAALSGGQQQRVAVARAIASKPSLVLADEPTANLDSATGEHLMEMMRDLNEKRGMTFIFSTHDQMVMDNARRVIHLRDGKIESDETR